MPNTNYPFGLTSYGAPVVGGGMPFTFGKYYFVNSDTGVGSDGNRGTDATKPFASIGAAYDRVVSNKHDVIVLSGNSAHAQTEILDFSKSRFHIISAANRGGSMGIGARSRITMGVTTSASDIAVMKNTGVGNTFSGIKFDSANTKTESLYALAEGGEYAIYNGCEIYKSTDLDNTAAAEILNNGDSAQWLNCYIGSTANITAAAKIRANMLLTATLSGKKCRDNYLYNCIFAGNAADTAHVPIYGANATDVERMFIADRCKFINSRLAAGDPAHAVGFGAAQTEGDVLLDNCTYRNITAPAEAAMNIGVTGAVPTFATSGVAVDA